MSKAQTDIRTTSYDAATANAVGYNGTIENVLAQIRAEAHISPKNAGRAELEHFLGVDKSVTQLSGVQAAAHHPGVYVFPMNEDEDWSVEYGSPSGIAKTVYQQDTAGASLSPYSLEYAVSRWPQNFKQ
jgi:hypothetical protein